MPDYRVNAGEAQEDQVTAAIEKYTSQVPSSVFLGLAIASIAASMAFKASKKEHVRCLWASGLHRFCCLEFITNW